MKSKPIRIKPIFSLLVVLVLSLAFLAACAPKDATQSKGGISIVSTVFPSYDFARQITAGTNAVPSRSESAIIAPNSSASTRYFREKNGS